MNFLVTIIVVLVTVAASEEDVQHYPTLGNICLFDSRNSRRGIHLHYIPKPMNLSGMDSLTSKQKARFLEYSNNLYTELIQLIFDRYGITIIVLDPSVLQHRHSTECDTSARSGDCGVHPQIPQRSDQYGVLFVGRA